MKNLQNDLQNEGVEGILGGMEGSDKTCLAQTAAEYDLTGPIETPAPAVDTFKD
jgi:hypothetical protein